MSNALLFRPVEANLTHDTNWLGKMDPYVKFSIGANHAQSSVCRHGGTRPHWGDTVTLPTTGLVAGTPNVVRLEVFDKDKFRPDDHIAYTDIDLTEILQRGSLSKWYPLYHRKHPAGEILVEAALQQQQQQYVQTVTPVTTYVQETVVSTPIQGVVGESYIVSEQVISETVPVQTTTILNQGSYAVDPNLYNTGSVFTGSTVPVTTDHHLASKTSLLGPAGGLPHGFHALKGQTNAGYSERPGYTLGDTEANPTCQTNLDSNGGGFFNKPGREKRVEPYSLSNPGTYGIPHGQTIDTSGHLRPDVQMQRQAPIGTVNHPGVTGYVDGYNVNTQPGLYNSGLNSGSYTTGTGLSQPGSYTTGNYTTGLPQGTYTTGLSQGNYTTGLPQGTYTTGGSTGLNPGSYTTGLNPGVTTTTGLHSGLQPGSYTTGLPTTYSTGQPELAQGNLIGTLGQYGVGTQPLVNSQQAYAQQGVADEKGPNQSAYTAQSHHH